MKIDGKTYIILGRHGKSVPNGDFEKGIEFDDRLVELCNVGHEQTFQFGRTVGNAYPEMLFTITDSTHVRAGQSSANIKDGIETAGDGGNESAKVLAISSDPQIVELDPGFDMTNDRDWIYEVYRMRNNDGSLAQNTFRRDGKLERQDFWAEYYHGRKVFNHEKGFDIRPVGGESLREVMQRAEEFKVRLQKFAETQDFSYLGFSTKGAESIADIAEEIMPIIVSHKGFLNCFFKQAGLTGYHIPTDKMMIPNAEPIMISIDENGKFEFVDMREQGFYLPSDKDKFSEKAAAKSNGNIQI